MAETKNSLQHYYHTIYGKSSYQIYSWSRYSLKIVSIYDKIAIRRIEVFFLENLSIKLH